MKLIIELLVRAFVLLVTAYLIPGFRIDSYWTAVVVAVVLGILNLFIKPVLQILTLPINIITLGLFNFIINAILLLVTAHFVRGFQIDSFFTAIIAAVVIALVSSFVNLLI